MGFFSFITSDTNKSIANVHSNRKTIPVYLITRDRQIIHESRYSGYGKFGNKDIFALIGELNGLIGENEDKLRSKVFRELISGGITNGKVNYRYGIDFENYESPIPSEGNKTANQLRESGEFRSIFPKYEFDEFANAGINVPKVVQKLPKGHHLFSTSEWEKYFDSLPHTKQCPAQGYFY
jgi:hypothetical protein